MTPTLASHLVYAAISISLIAWVGRALKKAGSRFLHEVFSADDLADSVNQLLLIGFYLVNIGFVARQVRSSVVANDATQAVELLADKIGIVALVLGGMHFMNLFVFSRIWKARPKTSIAGAGPAQHAASTMKPLVEIPGAPTSAAIP
jgi:hypothetical protein